METKSSFSFGNQINPRWKLFDRLARSLYLQCEKTRWRNCFICADCSNEWNDCVLL